ncbi:UDP-N-acetylmuramoyl-tripeptide--D-alanyl-D-alanine ligase [Salibaculum halophilum]|uniref:UDP-N-acetylmuramoyl-tripeptide--D-alanyl-D- alanine ligase n=1 Tax=Salibaculum halophilum TaxID=1914408 RepID=UPI000A10ACDA|nr:UDP-N-acetylmuramoyl-tripeptide--D-alanyl-D-alanine ligase [Salibaculum halophilum]
MALWTAAAAAQATGGQATGDFAAIGVSIDTRSLQPGDLFVALRAARDGHDFVAEAFDKGAAAALVTHPPDGVADGAPLVVVDDVQSALEALGQAGRARSDARVLAITGSVGKTSAKEMARTVLAAQGPTHAAEASYNNHWGVPLTLARMPAETAYAVIEIGMNAPGEIAPLARMARPHVALITTVAAAHLEALGSLEAIASEKASIFAGLEAGGTAIFDGDLPRSLLDRITGPAAAPGGAVLRFGADAACHVRLTELRLTAGRTIVQADTPAGPLTYKLDTAGRHVAMNSLGVLAAVQALGADPVRAAMDLARWQPPAGRGTLETVTVDPALRDETLALIDDAFNANPASMAAAFEVLAAQAPVDGVGRTRHGRRVAILGDMLELGPEEMAAHAALAEVPALAQADLVHCAGPRMRALYEALPDDKRGQWAETAEELAAHPARLVDAGDVVLVKGSKGSRIARVVDAIRKLDHRGAD